MIRKITAMAGALALTLTLCGCGGGKQADTGDAGQAVHAVHAVQISADYEARPQAVSSPAEPAEGETGGGTIVLPAGLTARSGAKYLDGTLYVLCGGDDMDGDGPVSVCAVPAEGGTAEAVYTTGGYLDGFAPADDGSVWAAVSTFDEQAQSRSCSLVRAAGGAVTATVPAETLGDLTGYYYVNSMFPAPGGGVLVYVSGDTGLLAVLDGGGNVVSSSPVTGGWFDSLALLDTGELAGVFMPFDGLTQGEPRLASVDPGTGAMTELTVKGDVQPDSYTSVLAGDGETIWLQLGGNVCPYDRASGVIGEGDSWINMGVNSYDMLGSFLRDGALWTVTKAGSGLLAAPVRTGDDGRHVLTVAAMGADWVLTPAVAEFNQTHPGCRIEIRDYMAENPYIDQALEQLNYDIISGDIPDLYYLGDMPYDTLVKQGLLADLSNYVNSLDMSQYLENVLCAARQEDGALYSVIPTFTVSALAAPADAGLTAADMTVPRLIQWQADHPDTGVIRAYAGGEADTLAALIGTDIERYVNFNDAACSFDSPEFTGLLTAVRDMPKTVVDEQMGGVISEAPGLLTGVSVANYGGLNVVRQQEGFEPALLGWPGPEGGVMVVRPAVELAMSPQTASPEECWEFIAYFLGEGFQSTTTDLEDGGFEAFPVMQSVLDAGAQIFLQYGEASQEDIDYVNSILAGENLAVSRRFSLAEEVLTIVREEAQPFFQGQATAEAAAAGIQSRVGIYLSEHS